jgi:hypothetical protein
MEWTNARLGKAPRLAHSVILDRPVRSPIAAAAQIYMRGNESKRRPNAAHKRCRDIPSCAKESADMRGRLGAISVKLADQERGRGHRSRPDPTSNRSLLSTMSDNFAIEL